MTDTPEAEVGTALVAPTDAAIQSLRSKGATMVAFAKERNELARQIEGVKWGSVTGASLSIQTRTMLAQYCVITRANPLTQVDLLGGKPYLNANYWLERIINDPAYVDHLQREITEGAEANLRQIAKDHRAAAAGFEGEEAAGHLARALKLEAEASEIAVARANYNPPKNVTSVVETQITRFMNQAPLDAIRAGDMDMEEAAKWIITVSECNWAGSQKGDPVGNDHPEKTARTRSMRRCATRAFSAWGQRYDEQIKKAEEALEAEWEFVQDDEPAQPTTGPQAALASGEPEAGDPTTAQALPVRGQEATEDEAPAAEPEQEQEKEPPPFDPTDVRKRLFATMRDCGIVEKKRKAWAKKNKLPESTSEWGKDEYERALGIMVDPLKAKVAEGCETLGLDVGDLSLQVIGKAYPDFAKDYNALIAALDIRLEAAGDDEEDAGL